MKNKGIAVAIIYLCAGAVCAAASVIYQNYIFMCVAAMWISLGVLKLRRK